MRKSPEKYFFFFVFIYEVFFFQRNINVVSTLPEIRKALADTVMAHKPVGVRKSSSPADITEIKKIRSRP